eukprot:COSAG06_NODE_4787_length_3954_cov_12.519585_2_plen_111_part_00
MRCSGAVLLRVADNGGRYCTCRSTLLPTGPAWCTAWGLRALHQRGLAVHRRDWQAAARPPTESLTFPRKISRILSGYADPSGTDFAPEPSAVCFRFHCRSIDLQYLENFY